MDPVAIGGLVAAGAFAVGDWVSRVEPNPSAARRRVEYVCKPMTMVCLIVVAVALDPVAGADARRSWFVAALVFSLAGDVFLMLPRDLFVAGLSAFLVAHLCYIAGFWTDGPAVVAFLGAAVLVALAIGLLGRRILPAVGRADRQLVPPVAVYMVVIGTMVATAIATGNLLAAAGAVVFAASDTMIAWDRFVGPFPRAGVWIMVTYHLGQGALVLSLLR
jgi:uncharacterized membrane protein YhhN